MGKAAFGQYGEMSNEREEDDWYPTPDGAVEMLLANLKYCLAKPILDAGAGDGRILRFFSRNDNDVFGIDIRDRGNPYGLNIDVGVDFLTYENKKKINTIIMNPPFNLSDKFINKALDLVPCHGMVIALLRHTWMCGRKRSHLMPLIQQIIMCGRLKMLPAGRADLDKGLGGTVDFSWFVFRKDGIKTNFIVRA